MGSVDWQSCEDRVIVSPLYVVFDVSERIIRSYTTGSVRDNLKFSILSEFPISLPPINEQRRIAATLDKVEETIALRQEELTTLNHKISAPFWILQSAIFVLFSQNHQQYHLYVSWDMSFLQRWSFLFILILEFAASYVIAKIEYPKDFRVSEEYVDIKNGQLVMQQIEDDS